MKKYKLAVNISLIGVLVVLVLLLIVSCSGGKNDESNSGDPTNPSGTIKKFKAPLTGETVEFPVNDRPLLVMVENQAVARPQSGLFAADIVYEILAEGDITRFAAVFQSREKLEIIGPVRSLRPYFAELGAGLDAFVVHAGWSPEAIKVARERNVDRFDDVCGPNMPECRGDSKYYWRDNSRKMPHNLYTNIENIRQGAKNKNYRTIWTDPLLKFVNEPELQDTDIPFSSVKINYYNGYYVTYDYDTASKLLKRSMDGAPHLDRETSEQIAPRNVLICFTKHETLDKKLRRAVDVTGQGKGFLLQNGNYNEVTWENKNGAIRAFANGTEVGFLPGKTWVQVVPEEAKIEWQP